jgi:hypothetical protein
VSSHCRFCESDFVSGHACRTEKERDKCAEWAAHQMARCDYWNGRKSLSGTDDHVGSPKP